MKSKGNLRAMHLQKEFFFFRGLDRYFWEHVFQKAELKSQVISELLQSRPN
jgi:hypothetical protein